MSVELQPTLTGKLVSLRPLQPADHAALYAVAADPLLWEQHPQPDRCEEAVFAEFFRGAIASGGALLVADAATGEVIGTSRFAHHDEASRSIEIGYTFLARSHWGGRYNGELKALMLAHAFAFVDRVIFVVGPRNFRSQRALVRSAPCAWAGATRRRDESAAYSSLPPPRSRSEAPLFRRIRDDERLRDARSRGRGRPTLAVFDVADLVMREELDAGGARLG